MASEEFFFSFCSLGFNKLLIYLVDHLCVNEDKFFNEKIIAVCQLFNNCSTIVDVVIRTSVNIITAG